MITDAGKWLEISTSRHLSSLMTGWVSAPSNDSANNCRFYWQQAIFLPATFKTGDDQSLSKVAVMAEKALHNDSVHLQGMKDVQNPDV